MILGIYSDLHCNKPALDSMLSVAGNIDQWISLGDSVGLYPQINEILDWQYKNNVIYVRGDHEVALLKNKKILGSFTGTDSIKKNAKIISSKNFNYLSHLKNKIDVKYNNIKISLNHFLSSQSKTIKYKKQFDLMELEKIYSDYDFVFFGHTHLPAVIYGQNTIFINPGSAGFPIDVERRCSIVVFNTKTRIFNFIRYDYDTNKLIKIIKNFNYNPKLINYILNGHRWI
jgi:predicted phosphodiesterase